MPPQCGLDVETDEATCQEGVKSSVLIQQGFLGVRDGLLHRSDNGLRKHTELFRAFMVGGAVHGLDLEWFALPVGANDRSTWTSLTTQMWGRRGRGCGGA